MSKAGPGMKVASVAEPGLHQMNGHGILKSLISSLKFIPRNAERAKRSADGGFACRYQIQAWEEFRGKVGKARASGRGEQESRRKCSPHP